MSLLLLFLLCVLTWCSVVAEYHVRRHGGSAAGQRQMMTGAPHAVPPGRGDVLRAARFAVGEFNRGNGPDPLAYKILNISSAKTQVVAGVNYILKVLLGRTVCDRSSTVDPEPCAFEPDPKKLQCHFIVTRIPWRDSTVLAENKCVKRTWKSKFHADAM